MAKDLSQRALDDLAKSGIDATLAMQLGIVPVPTGVGPAKDNYRIPYRKPDGSVNGFYRDKLFDTEGQKYAQPAGTAPHLYLPPRFPKSWTDVQRAATPLVICEGEKKAICAVEHAKVACIGLGGIWNWMRDKKPIVDWDEFALKERDVVILFDSDPKAKTRTEVERARWALATELSRRGARVRFGRLPQEKDKVGLDDWLMRFEPKDRKAAMQKLLEDAAPFDDVVARLNQQIALVGVGKDFLVAHFDESGAFELRKVHAMRDYYTNDRAYVGDKLVPVFDLWLQSQQRRQLAAIVFEPGREAPGKLNLWRGFSVEPRKGDCTKFLAHLRDNVCSGDKKLYDYVMAWLATMVQFGERPGTAIAMRGGQGVGKSIVAEIVGALLGPHYKSVVQGRHLTGNFNAHLEGAILVFADEAFWAGDKRGEGALKSLITSPYLTVERKGVDTYTVRNHAWLMVASNHDWVVPGGDKERRWLVLDVADTHQQDTKYFGAIAKEMQDGGREALLHFLQHHDTSKVDLRKIPQTAALVEQQMHSLSSVDNFIFELLQSGSNTASGEWATEVPTKVLQSRYVDQAKDGGVAHRATETELGMVLHKLGVGRQRTMRNGQRSYVYTFPELVHLRAQFAARLGATLAWDSAQPTAQRRKGR
jgi:hypothetical protein